MKVMARAAMCTRCCAAAIWSAAAARTFTKLNPQQLPPLPSYIEAFTAFLNSRKATYAAFASAAFTLDIM